MSEKSGMQMLEELCEQVMLLSRRLSVIEQNTKELLGRANGMPVAASKPTVGEPTITAIEPPQEKAEQPAKLAGATTKVIGKVKNSEGKLVSGVQVRIVGAEGNVVKETKTNRAGELVCFLPPGTYKAQYFLENIINASVDFSIGGGEKVVRLAQPAVG